MAGKTDNKDPAAKLELRRYFLRKYHAAGEISVLDCCQASGFIWRTLCAEFPRARSWGVDLKEKPGRLRIDSVRILQQAGWPQNVVDVDTYGSLRKPWSVLLPNVTQPLTVFLTIGQVSMGTDKLILQTLGLTGLPVPPGIAVTLHDLALAYLLSQSDRHRLKIVECKEAIGGPSNARYIGVRLVPG